MKRSREPDDELLDSPGPEGDGAADHAVSSRESSATPLPPPAVKIIQLDPDAVSSSVSSSSGNPMAEMKCSLPPHPPGLSFPSYEDYETHYHKAHTNRCLECRKNFPSEHILGLHIEECHDSLAAVRREKGEHTYSCFVEGCDRKCRTPQKRRLHMIDKHGYPRNYFFALTKEGIDGRRSLLLEGGHRRRRLSASTVQTSAGPTSPRPAKETARRRSGIGEPAEGAAQPSAGFSSGVQVQEGQEEGEKRDTDMADLSSAMSALQFVPNSVRFGRGGGRPGFARR